MKLLAGKFCGFVTLEVLMALTIIVMTISSVLLLTSSSQLGLVNTQTNQQALYLAKLQLETAKAKAEANFYDATLTDSTTTDDGYVKTLTYTDPIGDSLHKRITSSVQWGSGTISITSDITNLNTSETCNIPLSDQWKNPTSSVIRTKDLMQSVTQDSSQGLGIADMKLSNAILYVAANATPASDATKSDFYLFSVPENPTQILSYVSRVATAGNSINAIAIATKENRQYAYVATAKANCGSGVHCPQFQAIEVTDPHRPTVISAANLTMPTMGTSNNQGSGKSIFYLQGYVYLGLVKPASGPEFYVIDVSDVTHPKITGSFTVGRTVNHIFVKNNYAYLATDDNNQELIILDISDRTNPHLSTAPVGGFFNAPGSTGFGLGYSVLVHDDQAYFGRSYVGNAPELYLLDARNPATYPEPIAKIASKDIGTPANPDSINQLLISGNLLFSITNRQLQIWNVSGKQINAWSSNNTPATFLALSSIDQTATGSDAVTCGNNSLYLALQTSQGSNQDLIAIITPST